jgi:uncharacterized membrane protein (UPF0127 family)
MQLTVISGESLAELEMPSSTLKIPVARTLLRNAFGLLGASRLADTHGLVVRSRTINTVGMRFPIALFPFNDEGCLVAMPVVAHPGGIYICPQTTRYVAEVHPSHADDLRNSVAACGEIRVIRGVLPTLMVCGLALATLAALLVLVGTICLWLLFR